MAAGFCAALASGAAVAADAMPVYRFYNNVTGVHFYTISAAERDSVLNNYPQFLYEGAVFWAFNNQEVGTSPVYRFYNTRLGTHFYTQSETEKNYVIANYPVFAYEGARYYAPPSQDYAGSTALFRFYNTRTGAHFFTRNTDERDHVLSTWPWFAYEGVAYFVMTGPTAGGGGNGNIAPKITLGSDVSSLTVPGSVTLTANASDDDGTIASVKFYNGTSLIATITAAPYSYAYSATTAGTMTFTAVAEDNAGATTTSNMISVVASSGGGGGNIAPKVTLSASSNTISVPGSSTLTAAATDDDGTIANVKFYNGASLVATVTSAPFQYTFNATTAGTSTFTAVAQDNAGATTTSNAVAIVANAGGGGGNIAPKVTLAASTTLITVPGSSTLTATASDDDGTIANVKFYNGSTLLSTVTAAPYRYTFNATVAGTSMFTAVAQDNAGATTTSNIVAIVANANGGGGNIAPKVTLASSGMSVNIPGTVVLTATASDDDGTVNRVQFFAGNQAVATVTTAPYTYTFNPTQAGTTVFTAVARDNSNATTTSNALSIVTTGGSAGATLPKMTFTVSSTLVPAPGTVSLTATNVTSTGGSITRVSFYMNGAKLVDKTTTPYTFTANVPNAGTFQFTAEAADASGATHMTLPINVQGVNTPMAAAVNPDIWRLLQQATFGPTHTEAQRVQSMGIAAWVDDQFTKPISGYPDAKYNRIQLRTTTDCSTTDTVGVNFPADHPYAMCVRDHLSLAMLQRDFFMNAVYGADQLRQRVAWALSQIIVTSGNEPDLSYAHVMSRYQNLMFNNAFGNYETLLQQVTYSPAMGNYLDQANNDRASGTRVPNENYAREIMQLFSIGLDELNADGTTINDVNGMPVPTYDQNDIKEFAKVFTGLTFADPNNPSATTATRKNGVYYALPMIEYPITATAGHETGPKTLLNGTVLPPSQTVQQDQFAAVRNVFMHPNTPVYIGKQLIQRLVTGNPSPGYVQRISNVFVNNGAGVRGDLKAVVRAILLDPEARGGGSASDSTYGSLKEPVLMVTNLIRGLSGITDGNRLEGNASNLGQRPYYAPTVFNYFPPDQTIQGSTVLAPEFLIHTTQTAISRANLVYQMVTNPGAPDNTIANSTGTRLNTMQFEALAGNPGAMVDQVDLVMTAGQTPAAAKATIVTAVNAVAATDAPGRARMAVYLLGSSYYYQVQH